MGAVVLVLQHTGSDELLLLRFVLLLFTYSSVFCFWNFDYNVLRNGHHNYMHILLLIDFT